MKRRGFLKALGGAAAVPLVGNAALPDETLEWTSGPILAMQRQIMDNIYLASNPRTIVGHRHKVTYDQYGDETLGIEYVYSEDFWLK